MANRAGNINLRTRFREGKEVGAKSHTSLLTEHLLYKGEEYTFQFAESHTMIDEQSFHLVKGRRVRYIIIPPIHCPWCDDSYGWFMLLHETNLNGRGMCSQHDFVRDIECILEITSGVVCWRIECIEIVILMLNLWSRSNLESHASENLQHPIGSLCNWVFLP